VWPIQFQVIFGESKCGIEILVKERRFVYYPAFEIEHIAVREPMCGVVSDNRPPLAAKERFELHPEKKDFPPNFYVTVPVSLRVAQPYEIFDFLLHDFKFTLWDRQNQPSN
jgi:hypothetical protein